VLLTGGFQADLRLVAAESRGAALQYFTGSKAHNIALRDRAIGLGFKLNEYGVFRVDDKARVAGETEEDVYRALGLDWVPPELREMRGEIESAAVHTLPRLHRARRSARRPPHAHDRDRRQGRRPRDGAAARAAGTSTSRSPTTRSRWRWPTASTSARMREHAARIRADRRRRSRHSAARRRRSATSGRTARSISPTTASPSSTLVDRVRALGDSRRTGADDRRAAAGHRAPARGHPRPPHRPPILKRPPYPVDMDAVLDAAARHGVAVEINCQIERWISTRSTRSWLARGGAVGNFERRAFGPRPRVASLGRGCGPASLADRRRRAQHAAVRRVPRLAAPLPEPVVKQMMSCRC
jgi:DNA polymerase (family 10)